MNKSAVIARLATQDEAIQRGSCRMDCFTLPAMTEDDEQTRCHCDTQALAIYCLVRAIRRRATHKLTSLFLRGPPSGKASTDRKSTRLNSSHQIISYAVFC